MNRFYQILLLVLIVLLVWMAWRLESIKKDGMEQADDLKKSIIASDSLVKESEGRYTKLVDYYNTEKDLSRDLKESNRELYDVIKGQDERLLSLTNTVVSLKGQVEEGFGKFNPNDSNQIDIKLVYPKSGESPFITWNGFVNTKTAKYLGEWSFSKLPIQIVVTEEKRGLWKHRIEGPDWFIVDSLSVKSIPPDEYDPYKEKSFSFSVGGNYSFNLNDRTQKNIGVGLGLNYKRQHKVLVTANTGQELGLGYYYTFKPIKRRK